jgi:hypothetical protein
MANTLDMFPDADSCFKKISYDNDFDNTDFNNEDDYDHSQSSSDVSIPNDVLDKATSVWLEEYCTIGECENVLACEAPEPIPLFIKRRIITFSQPEEKTTINVELIPRFSEGYLKRLEREAEERKAIFAANRAATTARPKRKHNSISDIPKPIKSTVVKSTTVKTTALKIAKTEAEIRRDEAIAVQATKIAERIKSQVVSIEKPPVKLIESDESDEADEDEESIRIAFIKKAAASIISYSKSDEAKAANEAKIAADIKSKAAAKAAKLSEAKAAADAKAAAEAKADAEAKAEAVKAAQEAALWYLVKAPTKASKPVVEPPKKPIHTPQSLIKTMMCTSVIKNVQCRHGKTCRYAHTIDECNPVECKWGAKCKNGDCGYFHSATESKLEWVKRTCRC